MSKDVHTILKLLKSSTFTPQELMAIERVAKELSQAARSEIGVTRREQHAAQTRVCPHCGRTRAVKFGRDARGQQRFRCRAASEGGCGKTFTALTGTAFSGMRRRDQWGAFEAAMAKGWRSIDALHASGEVKVARLTLWRWRHRFLRALENRPASPLSGVVEADETYFRDSFKGSRGWKKGRPPTARKPRHRGKSAKTGLSDEQVPVVAAIDRRRQSCHHVLASRKGMEDALDDAIEPFSVLCSDGHPSYRHVAFRTDLEHVVISPERRSMALPEALSSNIAPTRLSLARINQWHEAKKTFVNRLARGVGTAYLSHYLTWQNASSLEVLQRGTVFEETETTLK